MHSKKYTKNNVSKMTRGTGSIPCSCTGTLLRNRMELSLYRTYHRIVLNVHFWFVFGTQLIFYILLPAIWEANSIDGCFGYDKNSGGNYSIIITPYSNNNNNKKKVKSNTFIRIFYDTYSVCFYIYEFIYFIKSTYYYVSKSNFR